MAVRRVASLVVDLSGTAPAVGAGFARPRIAALKSGAALTIAATFRPEQAMARNASHTEVSVPADTC